MDPFVLRGFLVHRQWPPMQLWTEEYMRQKFSINKKPRVRFGRRPKPKGEILHDHKSIGGEFADFAEMVDWMNGAIKQQHRWIATPETHWAYLDYRDILELLEEGEAENVDWVKLGVVQPTDEEEPWRDSTLWIGSPGAYSPCHYDTYGFNLHAQIRGRKRWLLFPPGTPLCPTRMPYEESSVFSSIDILGGPDGDLRLIEILPRAITLGPGDLLFVPPKWWHSVQCMDGPMATTSEENGRVSVSVNKWFPVEEDLKESAKEALLKFMMAIYANSGLLGSKKHICLSEQDSLAEDLNELAEFVQFRLNTYADAKRKNAEEEAEKEEEKTAKNGLKRRWNFRQELPTDDAGPSEAKRPREEVAAAKGIRQSQLDFFYTNFSTHPMAEPVPTVKWEDLKLETAEGGGQEEMSPPKPPTADEQLKMEILEAMSSSRVLNTLLEVTMSRREAGQRRGQV